MASSPTTRRCVRDVALLVGALCAGSGCSSERADADASLGRDATTPRDARTGDASQTSTQDANATADARLPEDSGLPIDSTWSDPVSLVDDLGRLAFGSRLHLVGHLNGQLVHRSSMDRGATWSSPNVIAQAAGNYPGMYGGLFAQGDTVYLITAPSDMASSAGAGGTQLDFRRSIDNGESWSDPVRITRPGQSVFRMRIAASGEFVHVVGTSAPTPNASLLYIRSTNGGQNWAMPAVLASNLGPYGGGQTVAVDGATVHVAYTLVMNGVGGGPTQYIRSENNGETWSDPVPIGENTAESSRQARVQLAAADGQVFAIWQREASVTGAEVPADRIGYNRSADGGRTWGTAQKLPQDTGIDRNHQHVWMARGGAVHVLWRIGNTPADPAGWMYSRDYGATWAESSVAVDTGALNHPWNIVADTASVHVLTGPDGNMQYARRAVP